MIIMQHKYLQNIWIDYGEKQFMYRKNDKKHLTTYRKYHTV